MFSAAVENFDLAVQGIPSVNALAPIAPPTPLTINFSDILEIIKNDGFGIGFAIGAGPLRETQVIPSTIMGSYFAVIIA